MRPGEMKHQVQFLRGQLLDNGLQKEIVWGDPVDDVIGPKLWAKRTPISDGEIWRASQVSANITARFVVYWSALTSSITPKDRLVCNGTVYDISGIKDLGDDRMWLEFTASAKVS